MSTYKQLGKAPKPDILFLILKSCEQHIINSINQKILKKKIVNGSTY